MLETFTRFAAYVTIVSMSLIGMPDRAQTQTYPIDCAILLCLSGGWPTSRPCTRARIEFIRRITPWPVEPPLQIWRCPMGASYRAHEGESMRGRLYDILFDRKRDRLSQFNSGVWPQNIKPHQSMGLQLVQNRSDIDISGPEFNFVRSIRVFDVRYARQQKLGRDGGCGRNSVVTLGTYGTQGEFSWNRSSPGALPNAHVGLESWGVQCPSISHRSVFVEWRDFNGNYGFEQVNY